MTDSEVSTQEKVRTTASSSLWIKTTGSVAPSSPATWYILPFLRMWELVCWAAGLMGQTPWQALLWASSILSEPGIILGLLWDVFVASGSAYPSPTHLFQKPEAAWVETPPLSGSASWKGVRVVGPKLGLWVSGKPQWTPRRGLKMRWFPEHSAARAESCLRRMERRTAETQGAMQRGTDCLRKTSGQGLWAARSGGGRSLCSHRPPKSAHLQLSSSFNSSPMDRGAC